MTETSGFLAGGSSYSQASIAFGFGRLIKAGYLYGYLNALAVSQRGAGANMSVDVATGGAEVGSDEEIYWYKNSAVKNLAIAAADPTNPRIDRVVLRLTFTGSPGTIVAAILPGTPTGSPSAPTLTQDATTWELSLAQVAVAAGAGQVVNANITDERDTAYCGCAGAKYLGKASISAAGLIVQDATAAINGMIRLGTDLGGTAAAPNVIGVKESGGQDLSIGSIPNTYYLKRSGTSLIGVVPTFLSGLASTTSVVEVTDTLDETRLIGFTLPANTLVAGTVIHFTLHGCYTAAASGPGNITFRIRIGATTLTGNIAAELTGALTSNIYCSPYTIQGIFTVRSAGGSGVVLGEIIVLSAKPLMPTTYFATGYPFDTTTADTTASRELEMTAMFSVKDAINYINVQNADIYIVKP